MALCVYFDGSGIGASVTTLAGIVAETATWDSFDLDWRQTLSVFGIARWHTTDALRRAGSFAGWEKQRVQDAKTALLNVILRLLSQSSKLVSCTINADALAAVRLEFPDTPLHVLPQLCINHLLAEVLITVPSAAPMDAVRMFFDPGEPFIKCLKPHWQRQRKGTRARQEGWAWRIATVEPVSAAEHVRVQAVDLCAWSIRSRYQHGDAGADPNAMLPFIATSYKSFGTYLDREAIIERYVRGRQLPEQNMRHSYGF